MTADEIHIILTGNYYSKQNDLTIHGDIVLKTERDKVFIYNGNHPVSVDSGVRFYPSEPSSASFRVKDVTIGIGFHWQQKEEQIFRGGLKIIADQRGLTLINVIPVEDYLISVISSEMSATSSLEMLRAHAVISRSWLLAQIKKENDLRTTDHKYESAFCNDDEMIMWYDREDHNDFDVCADDHCQRYQGITRATSEIAENAVKETAGEVLTYEDELCDTRFSKCCGGVSEVFQNVWEPVTHPYLQRIYDNESSFADLAGDLRIEEVAVKWIMSAAPAFCNTTDKSILTQVLNNYDQKTQDFYRWTVTYGCSELGDLIKNKTGIDFGSIQDLIPIERGVSGRLIKLKIIGSKKTMVIGKELEIRKALSASHLYSSAFFVEKTVENGSCSFILHGAGWGHGVGLCQIGAAVMGAKGYSYREILMHYFRGAELKKMY
jgi:SpoIID/LytB domain protein